jgi:pimeloyl-ACP methyl ester carboxylesterase
MSNMCRVGWVVNFYGLRKKGEFMSKLNHYAARVFSAGCEGMALIAPQLVARGLRNLIFTPHRVQRSAALRQQLALATQDSFMCGEERLCSYSWGNGARTVLLVHGWSGDATQLLGYVEPLCAQGFRVIALDLPAHGQSTGRRVSVIHFARAILAAAQRYGDFHAVVAHSMGAAAVSVACAWGLKLARGVFIAPVVNFDDVWQRLQSMMQLSVPLIRITRLEVERWLNIRFSDLHPVILANEMHLPLLVIHDPADRESPFASTQQFVANCKRAQLLSADKLGHVRVLNDPAVISQTVTFIVT